MKRVYAFDFLKVFATILIVFHHYQQLVGAYFVGGINFYSGRFYFGFMVEFFFLMSGFFLVKYIKPIQEGMKLKTFFARRYLRLIPLMLITAVAYEVLIAIFDVVKDGNLIWYTSTNVDLWGFVLTAFGLQAGGVFPFQMVNSPTWYISVLLICYVLFFIIVKVCHSKGMNPNYLFIVMILVGVAIGTYQLELPFLNHYTMRGYYSLFLGVLLGQIYGKRESKGWEITVSLLIIVIIVGCIVFNFTVVENGLGYLMNFFFFPSILIVFNSPFVKRIFSYKVWGGLGDIAYNVYVWQINVLLAMYIVISIFDLDIYIKSVHAMILFTLICFVVGIISHYVLEKPISKVISKRIFKEHS